MRLLCKYEQQPITNGLFAYGAKTYFVPAQWNFGSLKQCWISLEAQSFDLRLCFFRIVLFLQNPNSISGRYVQIILGCSSTLKKRMQFLAATSWINASPMFCGFDMAFSIATAAMRNTELLFTNITRNITIYTCFFNKRIFIWKICIQKW